MSQLRSPASEFFEGGSIPVLDAAELLRRHGMRPRRRLSQNFLQDPATLEAIATEAEISTLDTVLEIGCGLGHLTRYLAAKAARVVAVEVDAGLARLATQVMRPYKNVQVVCGDILAMAMDELPLPTHYVVAANIPYNIASAIIRHLLEANPKPRRIVLTVQKEVAERICAEPPRMSLLALSVQVYGSPRIVARIPASAFYPTPKVDSAVVRIEILEQPRIAQELIQVFFRLARAGFSQKRKTLRNSLSAGLSANPEQIRQLLEEAGIRPQARAEALGLPEWDALCRSSDLRLVLASSKRVQ